MRMYETYTISKSSSGKIQMLKNFVFSRVARVGFWRFLTFFSDKYEVGT